jgi:uroporphyrinogen-III decarboxylase
MQTVQQDGIHAMVPEDKMDPSAKLLRATYAVTPGLPFFQREFGFYCLERWREQGLPEDTDLREEFGYDPPGNFGLSELGWTAPGFSPLYTEAVIEDRGEYELARDTAGRHVLYFKGRRSGFMPEYVAHPVKDRASWEEDVKPRLDPATPARYADLEDRMEAAREAAGRGLMISQRIIGGYMYLRALMGPEGVLYMFYDDPELVHDCMQTWLDLADAVTARHQQYVTFDELFFGEDICYNHGPLISPDMIREFLFPYYEQLLNNIRARQIDRNRHMHFHIDTDGFADPVIPLYRELGMDAMSPFEVASGCDVVRTGREYPDLAMFGGIDKRILAAGPEAIDREIDRIFPAMRDRGGFIPTSDHGVPEEVSLADYRHYRRRCLEYAR